MKNTLKLTFILGFVICSIVSFSVAQSSIADIGETITTAQMANMFGGACPDKDCDTDSGSCPGGNTCDAGDSIDDCYSCKSGNGEICGDWQQSWGVMCVQKTPESCKSGSLGNCILAVCGPFISHEGSPPDCGTRPDC